MPRRVRDGRDGRDGRNGERGPQGERGPKGEPGTHGQNGADLALVPALATFVRDAETMLTLRLDVSDLAGAPLLSIVPRRDASNLMFEALITPL